MPPACNAKGFAWGWGATGGCRPGRSPPPTPGNGRTLALSGRPQASGVLTGAAQLERRRWPGFGRQHSAADILPQAARRPAERVLKQGTGFVGRVSPWCSALVQSSTPLPWSFDTFPPQGRARCESVERVCSPRSRRRQAAPERACRDVGRKLRFGAARDAFLARTAGCCSRALVAWLPLSFI